MDERKDKRVLPKKEQKEEISIELAEFGHLQPKQEPMTPNHRETAEKDRYY
ncbi:hypothetical protein [Sporosarcina sp. PTS2304]|uniref:hypothetical protein n=1 Tax=Sporosarcina sp. PTS2304 TaxID=2283194 RepID=UPI0013B364CF|nr:hypothetical protein [Sporosarcina sp. PTS2304]